MDKSRAKRVEHDKKRIGLIALVAIFSVSICVLGSMIGYKVYTKQSFEQRIESLKKEKDDQLSEGNQKDHFILSSPRGASDFICKRNHDTGY